MPTCARVFGCHACINSLRSFIEAGEQAIATNKIGHIQIALLELKSAVELARIIAFTSENKEVENDFMGKC
jgi:hypothetical protein